MRSLSLKKRVRECENDCQNHNIGLTRGSNDINRKLISSWRVRIAELSIKNFKKDILPTQSVICKEFIRNFINSNYDIEKLLNIISHLVKPKLVIKQEKHAKALEALRDYCGYHSDIFHLAKLCVYRWRLRRGQFSVKGRFLNKTTQWEFL